MKTCNEIIDETLAAGYTKTNRGLSPTGCVYISASTGVCCGVGRCCEAPQAEWYGNFTLLRPTENSPPFEPKEREQLLKPEYRGHSAFFWMELQGLHDEDDHWSETGLTKRGEVYVAAMRRKWGES
jgi:hypothetical protein